MVTIQAIGLRWVKGEADDPADQCVHGEMSLSAGDVEFVTVGDGELTLSGAAFYLLRTLESSHTPTDPVAEANLLLPCCAFNAWPAGENESLILMGCGGGVDMTVEHLPIARVRLMRGDRAAVVTLEDWRSAVVGFARQIEVFYGSASPKDQIDDEFEQRGWQLFWAEWRDLMRKHAPAA